MQCANHDRPCALARNHRLPNADSHVDALSPAAYARAVATQARRQASKPFLGEVLRDLSIRLNRERGSSCGEVVPVDVVLHVLSTDSKSTCRPLQSTQQLDDMETYIGPRPRTSSKDLPIIVLLQGEQPAECLTRLGARLAVDFQVYLRHLQYLWYNRPSRLFASPSLPSASVDIISFYIVTLGQHEATNCSMRIARDQAKKDMDAYLREVFMGCELRTGDSIVRGYWIHSPEQFSIEQEVTASLQHKNGQWSILIWSDIAGDLNRGPSGPWKFRATPRDSSSRTFPPDWRVSLCGGHKKAMCTSLPVVTEDSKPVIKPAIKPDIVHSSELDCVLMALDPFYCLSDLFTVSAHAIDQLLKLIEDRIKENVGYNTLRSHRTSHEDLLYHQDILHRVRERTIQSLGDIRHYRHSWPKNTNQEQGVVVDRINDILERDFCSLRDRIDYLLARCQDGMAMCMSIASINGAEKSHLQAERIGQLTWLAFFYTPLSFTTSFFGMNLADFGEKGGLPTWVWFAVSLPVVCVSYAALLIFAKLGRR